jgi:hypothetical protein
MPQLLFIIAFVAGLIGFPMAFSDGIEAAAPFLAVHVIAGYLSGLARPRTRRKQYYGDTIQ